MTAATHPAQVRWRVLLLAALTVVLGLLLPAAPASAAALPAAETRVGASALAAPDIVGVHECITAGQRPVRGPSQLQIAVGNCVAAEGAESALSGVRLRAQLAGQEIAGGHAFEKHILDLGEFPGVRTRAQFASHIEDVIIKGEMRPLSGGRTAYWREGTVVIRNPRAADGGTAFQPGDGYDYFRGLH